MARFTKVTVVRRPYRVVRNLQIRQVQESRGARARMARKKGGIPPKLPDLLSTTACTPPWRGFSAAMITVLTSLPTMNGSTFRKGAN